MNARKMRYYIYPFIAVTAVSYFSAVHLSINVNVPDDLTSALRFLVVNEDIPTIKNDTCLTFPKVHDLNPDFVDRYNDTLVSLIDKIKVYDREFPTVEFLGDGACFAIWGRALDIGARFAIWSPTFPSEASAWEEKNGRYNYIQGPGWVFPRGQEFHPRRFIHQGKGSYVGFSSIFPNNYGHLIHDHLPVIAWLVTIVPPTTKFILYYDPVKNIMEDLLNTIDPTFVADRVVWLPANHVFQVTSGELMVIVPDQVPTYMETRLMQPLQKWLAKSRPSSTGTPDGLIIFYSRTHASNVEHGRAVELNHEQEVIKHIRQAMIHHGRKESLYIFNGMNGNETMSISMQRDLFRSATTIIGPHGSGLVNMIWLDMERAGLTCEERPQVLEFIAGPDSGQVQHGPIAGPYLGYHVLFRGLPIDYHNLLYTDKSSSTTTYIHLEALDLALDDMWGKSTVTS